MSIKLYKKLHEIQKSVSGLKKDSSAQSFQYLGGNKILSHIKPLMAEHGLLLKQEILSIENTRQDFIVGRNRNNPEGRPKSEILSKVMMRFTWIDVETGEKDENLFGANGQNDWEKGLGSALTYGERYFLLKYFHIETDKDDVDNPHRKIAAKQANDDAAWRSKIADCKTLEELTKIWKANELYFQSNPNLIAAFKHAKSNIKDPAGNTQINVSNQDLLNKINRAAATGKKELLAVYEDHKKDITKEIDLLSAYGAAKKALGI